MHLRLEDEFPHWGMKGGQERHTIADKMCEGPGSSVQKEISGAVAHLRGTEATWDPLGLLFPERGCHMSWAEPLKDILVHKSSLAGAYSIDLTTGFLNFTFKTANEPTYSTNGLIG